MESAGTFSEKQEVAYTPDDIRFTCRNNLLDATCLGWPGEKAIIPFNQDWSSSFTTVKRLEPGEIESVRMLGIDRELNWSMTREGLEIEGPKEKPCEHTHVFKIARKNSFQFAGG